MNGRLLSLAAMAVLASVSLLGNTTTVTITSGSGAEPYTATVGGVPNVQVICDDDYNFYNADYPSSSTPVNYSVLTLNQLSSSNYTETYYGGVSGMTLSTATTIYDEIAFLALQFASNASYTQYIQDAVWDVFAEVTGATPPIPVSGSGTNKSSDDYWLLQASGKTPANPSLIEILSPLTKTGAYCNEGTPGGCPSQEFIIVNSASPEPVTYAMLGGGLILLSLVSFRRKSS